MEDNEVVVAQDNPIQSVEKNIDDEINEIAQRLHAGGLVSMEEDLNRLSYLQKVKSALRYASLNEKYDDVMSTLFNRFNNEYPTFTNKELLDYATQIQQIIDNTRKAANDDMAQIPVLLQNNTQININPNELDRASKERVADVVKAILKGMGDNV